MSKRPAFTLLDYGFQCTSKQARVTGPSAEVLDLPEQDPKNHSQGTPELDPGPAGYVMLDQ